MIKAVKLSFGLLLLTGSISIHAQNSPAQAAEEEAVADGVADHEHGRPVVFL